MDLKRNALKGLLGGLLAALGLHAAAAWPERPITLVVPFGAGGITDTMARRLAEGMAADLGQPVVVDNKPGAGGMLGSQQVARSAPDGYTLLFHGPGAVLNNLMYKKPLIDIRKDLAPVSIIASVPNFLAVGTSLPVKSTQDLVALARSQPGKLSCGHGGVGTMGHLSCELFKKLAGVDLIMVPYKGFAPAISELLGGNTTMVIANESLPFIRDGRLKGLGVSALKPSPAAPELPPIANTLPGYEVATWLGVFAPARTPDAVLARLNASARKVLKSRDMEQYLASVGATPVDASTAEAGAFINGELAKWGDVVRPLHISFD